MARKPNYGFERQERERIKAEKKARRAEEKRAVRETGTPTSDLSAEIGGNSSTEPSAE